EKGKLAKAHGCDYIINYSTEDFAARVAEITGGKKCAAVYDGVGKDTFLKSLDCLRPRGIMASFGNASGKVEPFDLGILAAKGSLYVTRPTLDTHVATREDLVATANDLFDVVGRGIVKVEINQTYALKDAAQAHRDLAARTTTGSTVLLP
ncbi:MAG: zinc-binding dehydrogenase, partial [Aeromicrobium sp.]|nr:zinc-binding dehydrogenase [Burkholderiales bacterium]